MIAGEDNRDYRSFRPSYEYPVERRQVLSVAEDSTRVTHAPAADAEASAAAEHDPAFSRPLHFTVQNPNPMTMVRSCRYRLPLAVTFKDQDGKGLSREAALQIATRNRQSKVFRQQQLLMNGQTFYRTNELDRIEEFTNVYWDKGSFQLENTGPPVSKPLKYAQRTSTARPPTHHYMRGISAVGSMAANNVQYDLDTASYPIVQSNSVSSERIDNYNYEQRVKKFNAGWEQSSSTWKGDVVIPFECGPFTPYESRKSGRKPNKFVPFVEQMMVTSTFDIGADKGDRVGTRPEQYGVAQQLFEQSTSVANACRLYANTPPDNILTPYSVVINDECCWLNVVLDEECSGVVRGPLNSDVPKNIKKSALLSQRASDRLERCRQAYTVGSGVRFGKDIEADPVPPMISAFDAATRSRRTIIAGLVEHISTAGCLGGGLTPAEASAMSWTGAVGANQLSTFLRNPRGVAPGGSDLAE